MRRRKFWRRLRHALADLPSPDRWLEGHYVHEHRDGRVRRGMFYVWGQGGVMHPEDRPCTCESPDGPIAERHHPLIQRDDYRNRADHWRCLVADWYHINFGVMGRLLFSDHPESEPTPKPNLLDRAMTWLVGPPFSKRNHVMAPHQSKDSIYASDREGSFGKPE